MHPFGVWKFDNVYVRDLALVGAQLADILLIEKRSELVNFRLEALAQSLVSRIDQLTFLLAPIMNDSIIVLDAVG